MTVITREGKITASEDMLNTLSMFLMEAQKSYKEKGYEALSKMAEEISDNIYNALEDIDYFE